MANTYPKLVFAVKQGEEINRGFTIKAGNSPLDLSDYTVKFQVKRQPLEAAPCIIDKTITTTSDINDVGQITDPTQGQLVVHINKEDSSFATGEYSLIVSLVQYKLNDIISSDCCNSAIYVICEQ